MGGEDGYCTRPHEHHQHLCELKNSASRAELESILKNPKYVCANCGGRVNRGHNLCVPRRIRT